MKKILCLILSLSVVFTAYAIQTFKLAPLTIGIATNTTTVGTSAVALPSTALVGREAIGIYNVDASTKTVYIGGSGVTTANGFPLTSSAPAWTADLDNSVIIYGIVAAGTADVRTVEIK